MLPDLSQSPGHPATGTMRPRCVRCPGCEGQSGQTPCELTNGVSPLRLLIPRLRVLGMRPVRASRALGLLLPPAVSAASLNVQR